MAQFRLDLPLVQLLDDEAIKRRRKVIMRNPHIQAAFAAIPKLSRADQLAVARSMIKRPVPVEPSYCKRPFEHVAVSHSVVGLLQKAAASSHAVHNAMPLLCHFAQSFSSFAKSSHEVPRDSAQHEFNVSLLGSSKRCVATKTVMAMMHSTSRFVYSSYLPLLANSLVHVDRVAKSSMVAALCASLPSENLIEYVESERSDETPMPVSRKDRGESTITDVAAAVDGAPSVSTLCATGIGTFSKSCQQSSQSPCKLLQRESHWGVLVQLRDRRDGRFVHIVRSVLNWIQCMDRTTGEVYKECYLRSMSRPLHANRFCGQGRLLCNDQAKGIERAEVAIDKQFPPKAKRMQTHCELHIAHIGHSNTCDLVKDLGGSF